MARGVILPGAGAGLCRGRWRKSVGAGTKACLNAPEGGVIWALLQKCGRGDASLPRRPGLTGWNVILPQDQVCLDFAKVLHHPEAFC